MQVLKMYSDTTVLLRLRCLRCLHCMGMPTQVLELGGRPTHADCCTLLWCAVEALDGGALVEILTLSHNLAYTYGL